MNIKLYGRGWILFFPPWYIIIFLNGSSIAYINGHHLANWLSFFSVHLRLGYFTYFTLCWILGTAGNGKSVFSFFLFLRKWTHLNGKCSQVCHSPKSKDWMIWWPGLVIYSHFHAPFPYDWHACEWALNCAAISKIMILVVWKEALQYLIGDYDIRKGT